MSAIMPDFDAIIACGSAWAGTADMWKSLFLNLQSDPTAEDSECMSSFDDAMEVFNTIVYETRADGLADYEAAMQEKGSGVGTSVGYGLDSFSKWGDGIVEFFALYEECKLDYYAMSLGTSFQTLNGALNMGTNILFLAMPTEGAASTTNNPILALNTAATSDCTPESFGAASGALYKALFMVELPDATLDAGEYYEEAGRFGNAISSLI